MVPMLLAIDVGNTQSHLGRLRRPELVAHWRFATAADQTADELAVRVSALIALDGLAVDEIDGSIVSSVVPQLTPEYAGMCDRYLDGECLIVGPGLSTGMPIQLDNPRELGADRLVNAVAAYRPLRRSVRRRRLRHGDHLRRRLRRGRLPGRRDRPRSRDLDGGAGGAYREAARRSSSGSRSGEPGGVIGKSTHASLQSGIVYGFAGAVDAIARRVQRELGAETQFVATGGHAAAIVPFCEMIDEVDDPDAHRTALIWDGTGEEAVGGVLGASSGGSLA